MKTGLKSKRSLFQPCLSNYQLGVPRTTSNHALITLWSSWMTLRRKWAANMSKALRDLPSWEARLLISMQRSLHVSQSRYPVCVTSLPTKDKTWRSMFREHLNSHLASCHPLKSQTLRPRLCSATWTTSWHLLAETSCKRVSMLWDNAWWSLKSRGMSRARPFSCCKR